MAFSKLPKSINPGTQRDQLEDDYVKKNAQLKTVKTVEAEDSTSETRPVNMRWEIKLINRVDVAAKKRGLKRSAYIRMICIEQLEREGS